MSSPDTILKWAKSNLAAYYNVYVYENSVSPVLLRTDRVDDTSYIYSFAMNKADGGPYRNLRFTIKAVNLGGSESAGVSVDKVNPQTTVAASPSVTSGVESASVSVSVAIEADFGGIKAWLGTTPDFTPTGGNVIYTGASTAFTISRDTNGDRLIVGQNYYLRVAAYDVFDQENLTVSAATLFRVGEATAVAAPTVFTAGENIPAGFPVVLSAAKAYKAASGTAAVVIGVASSGAVTDGSCNVVTDGVVSLDDWTDVLGQVTLSENAWYFVAASGLSASPPASGYVVRVGMALNETDLLVDVQPSVLLA